jgi:hypothetical protein
MKYGNLELDPLKKKPHQRTKIENDYIDMRASSEVDRLANRHGDEMLLLLAREIVRRQEAKNPLPKSPMDDDFDA